MLESLEGPRRLAQFSIIGFNPLLRISIRDGDARVSDFREGDESRFPVSDPLDILRHILPERPLTSPGERFLGGAIGFFSYDAVRYWERVPSPAGNGLSFPDAEFVVFDEGFIFDHVRRESFRYSIDGSRTPLNLQTDGRDKESFKATVSDPQPSRERYEEMVVRAKEYIESGDIFQVVLSKRYPVTFSGSPLEFYQRLRLMNPSPYMYYLKFGARLLAGSSPEMLMRIEGNSIDTFPIAGTRPLTGVRKRDQELRRELAQDPKELAEHVMLVDLARNDLGKVCDYGTVRVREFMRIHRYSHVQHIVSHVTGRLRADKDRFDAFRAAFPAGTVSGAPKIRAMEIINELEQTPRGPYAGAVGYLSFNANADFAITIRTLVAEANQGYVQTGAGIVADSDPRREWEETEHKARALLQAMEA